MKTDAELDRMIEAAIADEWEDINRPPEWEETRKKLQTAINLLNEAKDVLEEAKTECDGTPEMYRIGSLADEVGFLAGDVEKQLKRM